LNLPGRMFTDEKMKLQTKIALSIIPLVLISIFVLGLWSIKKAEESVHKSASLYMNTIIDSYLSDVNKLNDLLVKNGLEKVASFVSEYKKNAQEMGAAIQISDKSYIFIIDESRQLIFCSNNSDKNMMETIWGPVAENKVVSSEPNHEFHLIEKGIENLYVNRKFKPWGWTIFFAMEDQAVHDAERKIRNATIGIASICSILSILMVFIILRRFFVVPINIIGRSAISIAKGEKVNQIDVYSKDELGDLARNMEIMSNEIQKHQAEIKKANDELEKRVKERTIELEKALSEIKTLRGIVPICSHCKKIRDDKGYWNQIEGYIQKHSEAEFSHGMCPECSDELYGKEDWYIEMKKEKNEKK
jgi:hypothetical protein